MLLIGSEWPLIGFSQSKEVAIYQTTCRETDEENKVVNFKEVIEDKFINVTDNNVVSHIPTVGTKNITIDGSPTVDNKCKTSFDTSDKIVDNRIPIDSDEQEQTEKRKLFGCPNCT